MRITFDPDIDGTTARRARIEARERQERVVERQIQPYDAILATSMLQVGVDVSAPRPDADGGAAQEHRRIHPGILAGRPGWQSPRPDRHPRQLGRPRDLAHYEQFRHYHETFYAQVEALSVTPFSATSLERGLDGVLVSAARVLDAPRADGLSQEKSAGRIGQARASVEALIEHLVARVRQASDDDSATAARSRLLNRLDQWEQRRSVVTQKGLSLAYERIKDTSVYGPLMRSAEDVRSRADALEDAPFVVANSMREVQPEINLLVSPDPDRLHYVEPMTAPLWTSQDRPEAGGAA
jgi:hypothetical protein